MDPGLYQKKKTNIYWTTQKRASPSAFRLFTGVASRAGLNLFSL